MSLAKLSIDLEARLSKLEEGFTRAEVLSSRTMSKLQAHADAMQASWSKAAGVLGGLFAGTSLLQGFNKAIQGLDALNDAADATGSSLEKLSALEDFGVRTGTTFSTVTDLLVKFNGELSKATPGSGTERALAAIGLRAEELRSIDPADALQKTAQALSGFADDGNKARLVQDLFGKSVREAAPFLKDLAEAGQLQAGATLAQAEAAERYLKAVAQLEADLSSLGRTMAAEVAPVVSRFIAEFRDGIEVFGSFGSALLNIGWGTSPFNSMAETMAATREQLGELKKEAAELDARIASPTTALDKLWSGGRNPERLKALREEIAAQEKLLEYLKRRQAAEVPQAGYSNEGRVAVPSIKLPLPLSTAKVKGAAASQVEQLLKGGWMDDEKLAGLLAGNLSKQVDALELSFKQIGALERERVAEFERFGEQLTDQAAQINIGLIDGDRERGLAQIELDRQAMLRRLDLLELYGKEREALEEKINANIRARQAALDKELVPQWEKTLAEWGDTAKLMAKTFDDLMDGVLHRTKDALAKWIRTGKLSVRDLADFVADTVAEMFAKQATAGLFNLVGFMTSSSPFAKGGAFEVGGDQVTAFASGGIVNAPTYFGYEGGSRRGLMGEAGPEAIMPLARGPDGKLGVRASAHQAGPTFNINIASGVNRAELAALVPTLKAQIKAELQASMRRPGWSS